MKTIIQFFAVLFLFGATNLQAQETIELERFDEIIVSGGIKVNLKKGSEEKAVLTSSGDANTRDVKVEVNEGILKIRLLKSLVKDEWVSIDVTYERLRSVKGQAGATVTGNSTINGDKIELRSGSGANLDFSVDVNDVEAVASEGGKLNIKGNTESQNVKATSGGQLNALKLKCNITYVNANTGGKAKVVARKSLEAVAKAGGIVEYKGNPEKVQKKNILKGQIREL